MQGNGPLNRKKNVTGTASEDSMKTEGPGMGTGPVGEKDAYQERREQQANHGAPGRMTNRPAQTPLNRPKQVTGQATGSMNTQGTARARAPALRLSRIGRKPPARSRAAPILFSISSNPGPSSRQIRL